MPVPEPIMTVGHSTRSAEAFLALLDTYRVTGVADIRAFPASRRHPHFSRERLAAALWAHGIEYMHMPGLGGRRRPRPDSPNGGWRDPGFRGYADHMESGEFQEGLEALLAFARTARVAMMCAEAKWWQCHRQLVADALVARGVSVRHIMSETAAPAHELTPFARLAGGGVQYPALV